MGDLDAALWGLAEDKVMGAGWPGREGHVAAEYDRLARAKRRLESELPTHLRNTLDEVRRIAAVPHVDAVIPFQVRYFFGRPEGPKATLRTLRGHMTELERLGYLTAVSGSKPQAWLPVPAAKPTTGRS